jgi:hypothetical protein
MWTGWSPATVVFVIRAFFEMSRIVQDWIDAVKEAIAAGMSQEEAQEKVLLPKRYPDMARDQRMQGLKKMNVGRLYQVLK